MNPKIAGTYWFVKQFGQRFVSQYNSLDEHLRGDYIPKGKIGWINIDSTSDIFNIQGTKDFLKSSDFKNLTFPEIAENEVMEIEIGKSGKVWIYD